MAPKGVGQMIDPFNGQAPVIPAHRSCVVLKNRYSFLGRHNKLYKPQRTKRKTLVTPM